MSAKSPGMEINNINLLLIKNCDTRHMLYFEIIIEYFIKQRDRIKNSKYNILSEKYDMVS